VWSPTWSLFDAWSPSYISVPQSPAAKADGTLQRAIRSIPSYVAAASLFLCICPRIKHREFGDECDLASWGMRAWVRGFSHSRNHPRIFSPSDFEPFRPASLAAHSAAWSHPPSCCRRGRKSLLSCARGPICQ
jgi:hypothetical protein